MKEEVEIAWSLYLSLENNIERSFEFVYPLIDENKNVVSIPYQQIIFASCSEINNLLNLLMGKYSLKPEDFKKNASMWNIRLFYRALKDKSFNDNIKSEIDPIENEKFYKVLENQSLLDQIKNETVFWTIEAVPQINHCILTQEKRRSQQTNNQRFNVRYVHHLRYF